MTDRPTDSREPREVGTASVLVIELSSVDNEEVTLLSITGSVIGLSDCVTEPDCATVVSVASVDNSEPSDDNSVAIKDSETTIEVGSSDSNVLLLLHFESIT